MITEQVAQLALKKASGLTLTDVCLGLGYTGVRLSNGEGGTCFTFRNELGPKSGVLPNAGNLLGMPATETIKMAMSINLAEASLGVATINALLNKDYHQAVNALEVMDVRKGDKIGMIGYFHPVFNCFSELAEKIYIFERRLTDEKLMPDWAEDILLPTCEVVVISGVTFINKTLDHILELSKNAKEIVIMGPSTCMAPDILRAYGVTILAGSRVSDCERLFKVISQGGGGLDILNCTEKICLRLSDRRE